MYRRVSSGKNAIVAMNRASGVWNEILTGAASSGQIMAGVAPGRSLMLSELFQQKGRLSSSAAPNVKGADRGEGEEGKKNGRKNVRSEEEQRKVAEHKAGMLEYKRQMTILRKEVHQETKEKKHAEAVSAALERRQIAKKKAAAAAVKREKAAINVALNLEKEAQQKTKYESGFQEAARIFHEREERKKNIHSILLEELEMETKYWIVSPEDVTAKITDDLWDTPGNNSAERQIALPDEHLWRFAADIGLYDQEEEPSERNTYLRTKMFSRMEEMQNANTYLRDRRRRWDNDTRGLLKDADRLLRKRRPAPPGYMTRLEHDQLAQERQLLEEERRETELARNNEMRDARDAGGEQKA